MQSRLFLTTTLLHFIIHHCRTLILLYTWASMEWEYPLYTVATILDEGKKDRRSQNIDVCTTGVCLENNVCRQFTPIFIDQAI